MAKVDVIKAEIQVANRENRLREVVLNRLELDEKEAAIKNELSDWVKKLEDARKGL